MTVPATRSDTCASSGGCTLRGVFRWTALAGGLMVLVSAALRSPPDPWGLILGALLVALHRYTRKRTAGCAASAPAGDNRDER